MSIQSGGRFIDPSVTVRTRFKAVEKAADKAAFRNFGHAAARIRKDAAESIITTFKKPSAPGRPPHTHKGAFLRRAWRFAVYQDSKGGGAVVGPRASIVGKGGMPHEYGGRYLGQDFAERATALPALQRNVARFANDWAGSIGE
jgi:hypothetical protein